MQEKHILWSKKHISNLKTFAKPLLNIWQHAKFAMLSSSPPPLSLILKLLLKADIWNCVKQSEVAQLLSPASGGRLYLIWHSICKTSTFKVCYFDFLFIFVMTCFSFFSVPGRFYAFFFSFFSKHKLLCFIHSICFPSSSNTSCSFSLSSLH